MNRLQGLASPLILLVIFLTAFACVSVYYKVDIPSTVIQFQCPVCPANVSYPPAPSMEESQLCPVCPTCAPAMSMATTGEEVEPCPVCPAEEAACAPAPAVVKTVTVRKEPWYARGKVWHYPPRFPLCTMDTCFDYARCDNMTEPLVYTYNIPSPPLRYFSRINESKYWTDDPTKACLFFVFLDTVKVPPEHPRELPYWNNGLNHVLITFADLWEGKNPHGETIGNASIMASIVFQTTSRPGFDISLPLEGKWRGTELKSVHPLQRKYFATFRGTRYLGENRGGVFRSWDEFRGMHNGKDVMVATTCKQGSNDKFRKLHPESGVHCDEDAKLHAQHNFRDLMNTTFGLAPGGRAPTSFRLIEIMSAGAIPVLINDNYVKPFDSIIHWHECILIFPVSQIARLIPALRAMREEEILRRQASCLRIYQEFLIDDSTLIETSMRALKERFMGVFPDFARDV